MNTTNNNTYNFPVRQTAINGLAAVGFVALIVVGISLAIYSTRFVPTVVNRVGSAAVYLGSIFVPNQEPALSVVSNPYPSAPIYFGNASSTVSTTTSSVATTTTVTTSVVTTPKPTAPKPAPSAGSNTNNVVQISGGSAPVAPYGLPDLTATISAIGYLTTNSADSFITSATVPSGYRPAVKFTIKNIGTNWTGTWRFSASIPTQTAYVYQSSPQQSLAPGESIDYTLGFDQAKTGSDQLISITANFDHTAIESNENNNNITAFFTVQ